ncbi:hypothetical protein BDV18DRAFT_77601 [Aspergillus unguis]
MSSTTLMTFLLCTGPHVRSVKLLGSWDNFSKPYVMERDKRVGAGHWRGCHTFTNIICDGTANSTAPARSGGLKMGGTYWYYYLLDDDIEYYNDAEPMTTHCPFLPGQPVNVLQVPVILPDTNTAYGRARSPGYQTAKHTMNPEDKYMNPREPPKPNVRLRTSPPMLQAPAQNCPFSSSPLGVITNRGVTQPAHETPRIKHSQNEAKSARSVSPPGSRGLRAAFRQWNTSTPSLSSTVYPADQDQSSEFLTVRRALRPNHDDRLHVRSQSNDSYMRSPSIANMYDSRGSGLPLRRPVSAEAHDSASLTIQERRALNTKIPDDSTPKNLLTLKPKQPWVELANAGGHLAHPPFMRRPVSTPSTPSMLRRKSYGMPSPGDQTTPTPETVMNKRLPTLPNSPSSVMDEALRDLDEQEKALDMEALASRFSDFTETDSDHVSGPCEKSRFSEWSTDSEIVSPESMTSCSTFNEKQDSPIIPEMETLQLISAAQDNPPSDPNTPHLTVGSESSPAQLEDSPQLDAPIPRLSVALSPPDLNIPGLRINDQEEFLEDSAESNPKRHAAFFAATELKGLGLSSPPAAKTQFPDSIRGNMTPTNDRSRYSMLLSQSAHMKEMMDELSYLKNMIQSGVAPDLSEHKI